LIVTVASLENSGSIRSRCVVAASFGVVNVETVSSGAGNGGIASLEAEDVRAHEVVPLDDLDEIVLVAVALGEGVGEHEASERITALVITVRVHLSSSVTRRKFDTGIVDDTGNLHVCGCNEELSAHQGSTTDQASAPSRLGAVRNGGGFSDTDQRVGNGRSP
jgi:hypothetical protein